MKALFVCVLASVVVAASAVATANPCVPQSGTDDVTVTYTSSGTQSCLNPCQQCVPSPGKTIGLYYTTFNGGRNVWRSSIAIDDSTNPATIVASNQTNLASLPGADGIVGSPVASNLLYLGAQTEDGVEVLNVNTGTYITYLAPTGYGVYHLAVLTFGGVPYLYGTDIAHKVARWPIMSDGSLGTSIPITFTGLPNGEKTPTTIIPAPNGVYYFTYDGTPQGDQGSIGHFGTLQWNAAGTSAVCTVLQSGEDQGGCYHAGQYDPYTNTVLIWGGNEICQYYPSLDYMDSIFDPTNPTTQAILDQGTSDGQGHIFIADNNGRMLWLDISNSKDITNLDGYGVLFNEASLDDVAPLIGGGSIC